MVRYLEYNEFLNLVSNCEITMNFRCLSENDLNGLFETFDKNNTLIKKQIGLKIPNDYRSEVISITEFGKLEKGDITLISDNKRYYLSIVEEVLYNEI